MIKSAVILGALSAPAAALSPPWLVCDNADGTTSEYMYIHAEDDANLPGMTTFEVHTKGEAVGVEIVIAHCASGKAMSYARADDDDLDDKIWQMIEGEKTLSLRQLSRKIRQLGVDTKYGRLDSGNCACNPASYRNSF